MIFETFEITTATVYLSAISSGIQQTVVDDADQYLKLFEDKAGVRRFLNHTVVRTFKPKIKKNV